MMKINKKINILIVRSVLKGKDKTKVSSFAGNPSIIPLSPPSTVGSFVVFLVRSPNHFS
jgi:hypothetical protein